MTVLRTTFISVLAVTVLSLVACVQGDVPRDETPTPSPTPTPDAGSAPTPTGTVPLSLNIGGPSYGQVVTNAAVVVHGNTQPGATVTAGSQSVVAGNDGAFQLVVALDPGENAIELVAIGAGGTRIANTLTVTFEAPASELFFLVITEPVDQSIVSTARITVAGQTTESAVVTVNGVGVQVSDTGGFSTDVVLEPGPNLIDLVGSSAQGRVLSTVLAVIYRP